MQFLEKSGFYPRILLLLDLEKLHYSLEILSNHFFLPLAKSSEFVGSYRQAMRRSIDLSVLSATMKVDISPENRINDIKIGYSALSPYPKRAFRTESELVGKQFTLDNIKNSFAILDEEFPLSEATRGGLIDYKRDLAHPFLIRFFHQTEKARGRPYDKSASDPVETPSPRFTVVSPCTLR